MDRVITPLAGAARISTGVAGLDTILKGGLTPNRLYLLEGTPGTGKTTFGLRFLLSGAESGARGLYITLSETAEELRGVAASHGWSLDGIKVFELLDEGWRDPDAEQSILYPSEVELGETIRRITAEIERTEPARVVFDSLSEMRLLAQDPLRYRRQVLALKHFFSTRACTVLLLDDKSAEPGDLQLHSLAHGVICLDQNVQGYGVEHRRLRFVKMRGQAFQRGSHDFLLDTGRLSVFPRLTASEHQERGTHETVSTGIPELDRMLGGGLSRGTNTLLIGPSGAGKTSTAMRCVHTALARGEKAAYYLFDESISTLLLRSRQLRMGVDEHVRNGRLQMRAVDPAELSAGEFACGVVDAVARDGCSFVVIDSLNAYQQAMPGEAFLLLHMHELLTYLNHLGVTTLLIVAQHGVVSDVHSNLDLSYLSDAMVLFRYFESAGEVHTAITAVKSRTLPNEHTIREFHMSPTHGLQVGAPLAGFEGILGGAPDYQGETELIGSEGA